jgi:hypothetical protein
MVEIICIPSWKISIISPWLDQNEDRLNAPFCEKNGSRYLDLAYWE